MPNDFKDSRQILMSVEGVNCEKLYFEHLGRIINSSGKNRHNARIICGVQDPISFAKRNMYMKRDCKRGKIEIPYMHVQDIEDYYDEKQKEKFYKLLNDMKYVRKEFNIPYILGYSNYTFELWMLLHVRDMKHPVADRYDYLRFINGAFQKDYADISEFKAENEFKSILDKFVTMESVCKALKRADDIRRQNKDGQKPYEEYKGEGFYHDNPDATVQDIVRMIFEICEVSWK